MSLIARIASLANRDRLTTVGFTLTGVWLFLVALFWLLGPAGTDGGPSGVARLHTRKTENFKANRPPATRHAYG